MERGEMSNMPAEMHGGTICWLDLADDACVSPHFAWR